MTQTLGFSSQGGVVLCCAVLSVHQKNVYSRNEWTLGVPSPHRVVMPVSVCAVRRPSGATWCLPPGLRSSPADRPAFCPAAGVTPPPLEPGAFVSPHMFSVDAALLWMQVSQAALTHFTPLCTLCICVTNLLPTSCGSIMEEHWRIVCRLMMWKCVSSGSRQAASWGLLWSTKTTLKLEHVSKNKN